MPEFNKILKTHFVADLDEIQDKLTADLTAAGKTSGLAVLVFANARTPFTKSEILPLVNYWNYRSRDHVTFFFIGYIGDEQADADGYTTVLDPEQSFHEPIFVKTIEAIEHESNWKYRGDTPLILCRGFLRVGKQTGKRKAFLDFDSLIQFELESALREKAIESVESFFEVIIDVAKNTPDDEVHWKLSDKLGAGALGDALIEAVTDKLKGTKTIINAVRFFRIKKK